MPRTRRRERHHRSWAKMLPANRLPVGTPPLEQKVFFRPDTRSSHRSTSSWETSAHDDATSNENSSGSVTTVHKVKAAVISETSGMDDLPTPDPEQPFHSLAEAKLQRQNERIRQAEAALNAPAASEPTIPGSRGKNRSGRSSDFGTGGHYRGSSGIEVQPQEDTKSDVLTRNSQPPSRDTSLSRSLSSVSRDTSAFGLRDEDDESRADDNGFQLYRSRRSRRGIEEKQPPKPNIPVEDDKNEREILAVFGSRLPPSNFIDGTMGQKTGQLQFVQHPNGDVSAHMWSEARMQWENLGQFSNVRKRIEGQLAGNRLKGETANQTLQHNSLAYFRTIAKQREAAAMGLPFGPQQIQILMPERRPQTEPEVMAGGLAKNVDAHVSAAPVPPSVLRREKAQSIAIPQYPHSQKLLASIKSGHRYATQPKAPTQVDDPFLTSGSDIHRTSFSSPPTSAQISHGSTTYGPGLSSLSQTHLYHKVQNGTVVDDIPHASLQFPGLLPYKSSVPQNYQSTVRPGSTAPSQHNDLLSAPKPTPQARTVMRDHLIKLGENAKERSGASAATPFRTVLHDPYRAQNTQKANAMETKVYRSDSAISTAAAAEPRPSQFAPNLTAWPYQHGAMVETPRAPSYQAFGSEAEVPRLPMQQQQRNHFSGNTFDLRGNIFPNDAKSAANNSFCVSEPSSATTARPFDFDKQPQLSDAYNEALSHWWSSGNTFQRQEEFFESIKAAHKLSQRKGSVSTTVSGRTSVSSESKQTTASPSQTSVQASEDDSFNEPLTRILVPIVENLSSYLQGSVQSRHDYWCPWIPSAQTLSSTSFTSPQHRRRPSARSLSGAGDHLAGEIGFGFGTRTRARGYNGAVPEYAIDRGPRGNDSFFDQNWGAPPARVGRDGRYRGLMIPAGR